jgi:hypothetical protein
MATISKNTAPHTTPTPAKRFTWNPDEISRYERQEFDALTRMQLKLLGYSAPALKLPPAKLSPSSSLTAKRSFVSTPNIPSTISPRSPSEIDPGYLPEISPRSSSNKPLIPLIGAIACLYSALVVLGMAAIQQASFATALTVTLQAFGLAALGTALGAFILYGLPALIIIASIIWICKNRSNQALSERIASKETQTFLSTEMQHIRTNPIRTNPTLQKYHQELIEAINECDIVQVKQQIFQAYYPATLLTRSKLFRTHISNIISMLKTSPDRDASRTDLIKQYKRMTKMF